MSDYTSWRKQQTILSMHVIDYFSGVTLSTSFLLSFVLTCYHLAFVLLQKECSELQRQLLEGKINGKHSRGRPRITWMDSLKEWTGKSYGNLIRIAEDREKFRFMTVNVLKALDTLWWWCSNYDIFHSTDIEYILWLYNETITFSHGCKHYLCEN